MGVRGCGHSGRENGFHILRRVSLPCDHWQRAYLCNAFPTFWPPARVCNGQQPRFSERLHNHEFEIGRASWYGDYYDPSTFTDVFRSDGDNNDASYNSPEYDALLKKASLETNPEKRYQILADAENLLLEDSPVLPLYQYVAHYLYRDNITNIPPDPRQMIMLQFIDVKK